MISFLLCMIISFLPISLSIKTYANEWEADYKYYTYGIVDGGVYKIKNVQTGYYMTLESDLVNAGTRVVLNSSSESQNQMFYVNYLGDNNYTFSSYCSKNFKIHLDSSANGTDLTINMTNTNITHQRFRILAVASNEYKILANLNYYHSALYAKYDSTIGWHIEQEAMSNLIESEMEWVFEKVDDRARDKYTSYYLRDIQTDLYLTVLGTSNGSQLSLTEFTGKENQRFKKYYLNNGDGFGYYYVPMLKTDMAVELSTNSLIKVFDKNNCQKFREITNSNRKGYKLSSIIDGIEKYISKGDSYTYSSNLAYNLTTTTSSSFAINFEFEVAYNETPFIYNIDLETSIGRSLTGYLEQHIYTIKPKLQVIIIFFFKEEQVILCYQSMIKTIIGCLEV